jgi:hypothetical protein
MTRPPGASGVTIEHDEPDEPDTSSVTGNGEAASATRTRRDRVVFLVTWAVLAVPLVVAIVRLAQRPWVPVLDLAQTWFRIRDITTAHPPLIGLPGRIGTFQRLGSHPGPISFYALWPFYMVFGASNFGMLAAASILNILAAGAALWIALRRGGAALVIAVGAALALIMRYYGPVLLTQPWNPYMPMLWFLVYLLAVWSVLAEDFAPLWLLVFAGTFCMQTHISYEALVGLLLVVTVASLIRSWYRRRNDRDARTAMIRPIVISVGLGVLLWLPPVVQQFTGHPPNLSILYDYFTNPPERVVGYHAGLNLVLLHLNPWWLINRDDPTTGSILPGLVLLLAWIGSAYVAWRRRARELLLLDLAIAVALVAGLASASRIFGYVWFYLTLWGWGLAAFVLLATIWGWSLLIEGSRSTAANRVRQWWPAAVAVIGVVLVASFVAQSTSLDPPEARIADGVRAVLPATERAIDRGQVAGGGRNGRYLITYSDSVHIGSQAYGLLAALERHGYHVGFPESFRVIVRNRRVLSDAQATAVIHLSVGNYIAEWRRRPGVREVAYFDARTRAERAEFARLRGQAIAQMRTQHLDDLIPSVDNNLFVAVFDSRVKGTLKSTLERMLTLGVPIAIFIGPVAASQ